MFKLTLALAVLNLSLIAAESLPEPGERELTADETAAALRTIAETFKASPIIQAKIVSELEDLAGKRIEEGEILIERPARVSRKFSKPKLKFWVLDSALLSEYSDGQKSISVKDLSGVPAILKQIQGAMTGDLTALSPSYTIKIFAPKDITPLKALRVVLDKKPAASRRLYKRIETRISLGEKFFSEVRYIPEEGDEVTEKFTDIKTPEKSPAADFALPAGIDQKIEKIAE